MNQNPRTVQSKISARPASRARLVPLAVLLLASALLGGCVVETPGHGPHPGWWWHHDHP